MLRTPKHERGEVALTSEQAEIFLRKMDEHLDTLDPEIAAMVRTGIPTVEEMAGSRLPPHLRPVTVRITVIRSSTLILVNRSAVRPTLRAWKKSLRSSI